MPARPPGAAVRRALLPVVAAGLLVACGASEAASPAPVSGTVGGVGSLPAQLAGEALAVAAPQTTRPRPSTTAVDLPAGVIGDVVDGNRVLLIGDSLMASTSRRYGGQMCEALVPMGWIAEVDAETGRFIDFGARVLDRRLRPDRGIDWDVGVVFLGNNYNGDEETYRARLEDIVARLTPRPVVLLTVTEFRRDRAEVNEVVRALADTYGNVRLVDWNAVTAADRSLVGDDGLHLTEAGRGRLAYEIAAVLGGAPVGGPPTCLSTAFSDDSAGAPPSIAAGGRTGTGSAAGGGTSGTRTTTTVAGANATTTTRPATVATTVVATLPATVAPAPTPAPAVVTAPPPPPPTPPPAPPPVDDPPADEPLPDPEQPAP